MPKDFQATKTGGGWTGVTMTTSGNHTGSKTNAHVRNYANAPGTAVPSEVRYELKYQSDNGAPKTRTMTVDNPQVGAGQRYDAGHAVGQQMGGSGADVTNIFPQHPEPNRWKSRGAAHTQHQDWVSKKGVDSWRGMEDKVRRKAEKYPAGVEVRVTPTQYHP